MQEPEGFRAILRNEFCIVCRFLIFVWDAVAYTGSMYVKSGLIIYVYCKTERLICWVELYISKEFNIFFRV